VQILDSSLGHGLDDCICDSSSETPHLTKEIKIKKTKGTSKYIPAVPQRPKPALKIVEPLLISATASSALSYTFDLERSIFGARLSLPSSASATLLAFASLIKPRAKGNAAAAAAPARLPNTTRAVTRGNWVLEATNKPLEDTGSSVESRVHERRVAAIMFML
jgi:hypothetical protein